MTINSYFYDSVGADRPYSAKDFSNAFDILTETGFLIRETYGGSFGFDIGGVNNTTIYAGQAVVQGHFVEVTGTEILTVPSGTYSGQVVIHVDTNDTREATLVVKQDRIPIQTDSLYELPIYDVAVTNGVITTVTDKRFQGGAVPNNHNHKVEEINGNLVTFFYRDNGVYLQVGDYSIALTPEQPPYSDNRVWIQTD